MNILYRNVKEVYEKEENDEVERRMRRKRRRRMKRRMRGGISVKNNSKGVYYLYVEGGGGRGRIQIISV